MVVNTDKIFEQIKHLILRKEFATPTSLFTIALVLRLNNIDYDIYGDEAFYFYLARHPEIYFTNPVASSHPPLLYYRYSARYATALNILRIVKGKA
ncbi:hypothetical protein MUP77_17925 [Candidatus Bathyarchaeota archaeon]|nr:hypothetical protein [Candidatus Bathyarchaeota archaeon]